MRIVISAYFVIITCSIQFPNVYFCTICSFSCYQTFTPASPSLHTHTYIDTPSGEGTHGTKGLPFLRELITSKIRRRNTRTRQPTTEFANSPMTPKETGETGIKSGKLLKTSRSRTTEEEPGTTKQRRFWLRKEQRLFRLTEDALEYYQQFNQVNFYNRCNVGEVVGAMLL